MKDNAVNTPIDPKTIKGWGIDADPENDPTYPMRRHRMNIGEDPQAGNRPDNLQPVDVEVLKSVERPNVSAVFGTPRPPRGLSGAIRRQTYKYSENEYKRWLPLVLADRVDMVEGVLSDLLHGKLPNIWAEKGYDVEMKYNRTAFLTKMATIGAVTAGLVVWLSADSKDKKSKRN
ncbi:hypothetical protein F1C16_06280 [Hymenobacter sp. NBH84]|uniref:Uncharacterized protein n=1 Tax=Hymenobacter defluvii TaxID=2054411 RepID=A0ABS3TA87_9BACT|nr:MULTISPECIES: hypothetical protein [Hymenobacter]MBO3269519.1 hypothetical protein [Hymenobacter defluvii]QNE39191.1 hypothetical protein F1C16_06280 [Hymenobacter sp. NBH84]